MKLAPLKNIKILDLTRVLAGPFCTMLLGDLGAEIYKIERPELGDETRSWQPPSIGNESCYFVSVNRNKKSIAVDLKHPTGAQIIRDLAAKCDILVENFIPGTMQRFGLDYGSLQLDRLIYCSISGYGQTGPMSSKGGYDVIAEAIGGLLHITGPAYGEPCKAGVAVTDLLTGLYAHGAIMAALIQRSQTQKGQMIDCNLLSTQISTLVNIGSNYLNSGTDGRRWGTAHESIVPYQAFKTKDSHWFVVGAGNDAAFIQLCQLMQLPELEESQLYKSNALRVKNRDSLLEILMRIFSQQPLQHWEKLFAESSLPNGPVNNMEAAFNNKQVVHMDMIKTLTNSLGNQIRVTGPAVKFSNIENETRSPPPLLGEHTLEVLSSELNMNQLQLQKLKRDKVIEF